jgi:hypothetical protein
MRAIVTIALLFVMAGMIFASLTADAPAAGVDYAAKAIEPKPAKAIDAPGDSLLPILRGESPRSEFVNDKPGQRSGNLLFHLKSMLQDF